MSSQADDTRDLKEVSGGFRVIWMVKGLSGTSPGGVAGE